MFGVRMKPFIIGIGLFFALLIGSSLNAQKIFTWTDQNGVIHLSDQPPPEKDRAKDVEVMKYEEKTPQEIEAIQSKKETLRQKLDKVEQIDKARQGEIQARKAEDQARQAMQKAQEEYEYNNEYIRRLTSTKNKRKKFRKRVNRIIEENEASRIEAKEAVERAEKAVQRARKAAEEARKNQ
jgi:hypothetical protein